MDSRFCRIDRHWGGHKLGGINHVTPAAEWTLPTDMQNNQSSGPHSRTAPTVNGKTDFDREIETLEHIRDSSVGWMEVTGELPVARAEERSFCSYQEWKKHHHKVRYPRYWKTKEEVEFVDKPGKETKKGVIPIEPAIHEHLIRQLRGLKVDKYKFCEHPQACTLCINACDNQYVAVAIQESKWSDSISQNMNLRRSATKGTVFGLFMTNLMEYGWTARNVVRSFGSLERARAAWHKMVVNRKWFSVNKMKRRPNLKFDEYLGKDMTDEEVFGAMNAEPILCYYLNIDASYYKHLSQSIMAVVLKTAVKMSKCYRQHVETMYSTFGKHDTFGVMEAQGWIENLTTASGDLSSFVKVLKEKLPMLDKIEGLVDKLDTLVNKFNSLTDSFWAKFIIVALTLLAGYKLMEVTGNIAMTLFGLVSAALNPQQAIPVYAQVIDRVHLLEQMEAQGMGDVFSPLITLAISMFVPSTVVVPWPKINSMLSATRHSSSLVDTLLDNLKLITNTFFVAVTGKHLFSDVENIQVFKEILAEMTRTITDRDVETKMASDVNMCERIVMLYEKAYKMYVSIMANPSMTQQMRQYFLHAMQGMKSIRLLALTNMAKNRKKVEPVTLCLQGKPNQGKSFITPLLVSYVYSKMREHYYVGLEEENQDLRFEQPFNGTQCWSKPMATDFWDGYSSQFCVVMDDVFQRKDKDLRAQEALDIIHMVGPTPMNLNMASVDQKGLTYFHSEMVVLTTNFNWKDSYNIEDPVALSRRLEIPLEVKKKTVFELVRGKPPSLKQLNEAWEFVVVDLANKPIDTYRGCKPGDVLNFEQVAQIVLEGVKSRKDTPTAHDVACEISWADPPNKLKLETAKFKSSLILEEVDLEEDLEAQGWLDNYRNVSSWVKDKFIKQEDPMEANERWRRRTKRYSERLMYLLAEMVKRYRTGWPVEDAFKVDLSNVIWDYAESLVHRNLDIKGVDIFFAINGLEAWFPKSRGSIDTMPDWGDHHVWSSFKPIYFETPLFSFISWMAKYHERQYHRLISAEYPVLGREVVAREILLPKKFCVNDSNIYELGHEYLAAYPMCAQDWDDNEWERALSYLITASNSTPAGKKYWEKLGGKIPIRAQERLVKLEQGPNCYRCEPCNLQMDGPFCSQCGEACKAEPFDAIRMRRSLQGEPNSTGVVTRGIPILDYFKHITLEDVCWSNIGEVTGVKMIGVESSARRLLLNARQKFSDCVQWFGDAWDAYSPEIFRFLGIMGVYVGAVLVGVTLIYSTLPVVIMAMNWMFGRKKKPVMKAQSLNSAKVNEWVQRGNKNKLYMSAQGMGTVEERIIVMNKVMSNVAKLVITFSDGSQSMTYCLFLDDAHFVFPRHILKDRGVEKIFISCDNLETGVTVKNYDFVITDLSKGELPRDAVIVNLSKSTIQGRASVRKYLRSKHDKVLKPVVSRLTKQVIGKNIVLSMTEPEEAISYRTKNSNKFGDYSVEMSDYCMVPRSAGESGECSFPYMSVTASAADTRIEGIHIASLFSGEGYGVYCPIYLEDFVSDAQGAISFKVAKKFFHPTDELVMMEGARAMFELVKSAHIVSKTEFHPTVFFETLDKTADEPKMLEPIGGPARVLPAALKPFKNEEGEVISPLTLATQKFVIVHQPMPSYAECLYQCAYEQIRRFGKVDAQELPALTKKQALFGCKLLGIDSLKDSKSPGFPYVLEGIKRKQLYNVELQYVSPRLDEDVDASLTVCETKSPAAVYVDQLKDELRPVDRVMRGKTRIFSAGPLVICILLKMCLGAWVAAAKSDFLRGYSMVGVNAHGWDWGVLANYALQFPNRIGGDFEAWDMRLKVRFIAWITEYLWEEHRGKRDPSGPFGTLLMFANIIKSAMAPYVVRGRFLYQRVNGNASGNWITSLLNSFINYCMFVMFFYKNRPNANCRWSEHCAFIFYGDDNFGSVSDGVKEWFNMKEFAKFCHDFGMVYTSPTKGTFDEFLRDDQLIFLARKFIFRDGYWWAPLDLDSIYGMLHFNRKVSYASKLAGTTEMEQLQVNIDTASRELLHHGREIYNQVMGEVRERIEKVGLVGKLEVREFDFWYNKFLQSL